MRPFEHLKHAALSDVGKKRKNNEDAFGTFPEAGLFCVADGMGGGDDGEIASAAVVRTVEELVARVKPDESGGVCASDVGNELAGALSTVSAWINNRAHARKLNGCGSTFVGVIFDPTNPAQALAVHAGDSRLYLLHGHSIRQITRDHSVAELMGEKDESKVNPMFRSMVVNGIGIRDKAEPEFTPFKIAPGDRVLLCSDGLSRMVPDKRIASISRAEKTPDKAVDALIAAALDAGGVDNVTAVLVQVGELPPPMSPRKPIPLPQQPEDEETEDGSTASDDTGKTDETRTCVTLLPEESIGVEIPTQTVESFVAKSARLRLLRRIAWIVLAGVLVAGVCGIMRFFAQRRGEGRAAETAATNETTETAETNATNEATAPAAQPAPPKADPPAPPKAVPKAVSPELPKTVRKAEPPAPPKTVRKADPPAPPKTVPKAEPPAPPKAVPKAVPPAPKASACADFIAVCGDDSVQMFVKALRRLLPQDDQTVDFAEESDRFLKGARKLALARGSREAEAAAVDLRVLLLNAEAARSAPVLRKADAAAKSALSAWDDVLNGNPADVATQMSCARLIKTLKDLR